MEHVHNATGTQLDRYTRDWYTGDWYTIRLVHNETDTQ